LASDFLERGLSFLMSVIESSPRVSVLRLFFWSGFYSQVVDTACPEIITVEKTRIYSDAEFSRRSRTFGGSMTRQVRWGIESEYESKRIS